MIERKVRIGTVADQDTFRRDDVRAMSPNERLMPLIQWRDFVALLLKHGVRFAVQTALDQEFEKMHPDD